MVVIWGASTAWSKVMTHEWWKVLTEDENITQRLMQHNETHLSMLGDPPFARDQLEEDIDKDGEGMSVEEILHGTFKRDLSSLDEVSASSEIKSFIKHYKSLSSTKQDKNIPEMNNTIDIETYVLALNKMYELTASSPSDIHYGHYIMTCEGKTLATVNILFIIILFRGGIALARWTRSLHYMIQKK